MATVAARPAARFLRTGLPSSRAIVPHILRPRPGPPTVSARRRFAHAIPKPPRPANQPQDQSPPADQKPRKLLEPHYELTFTCVPCGHRSAHTVSKQGYHRGTVLITCPSCRNRHIISDNLNIFGDKKVTIEDIMREKGQLVKRGTLGEEGDVEFWEDGSVTERTAGLGANVKDGDGGATEKPEPNRTVQGEASTTPQGAMGPSPPSVEPTNPTASTALNNRVDRPKLEATAGPNGIPSSRRHSSTSTSTASEGKEKGPWQSFWKPRPPLGFSTSPPADRTEALQTPMESPLPSTKEDIKSPQASRSVGWVVPGSGLRFGPPEVYGDPGPDLQFGPPEVHGDPWSKLPSPRKDPPARVERPAKKKKKAPSSYIF
ncbi:DNL zinc finger-domain-containing protein [Xylariaceae sp. FL0804]|nr:DNL zinc finger-domain-containing protein [Xylariaceae sp. FL0804]